MTSALKAAADEFLVRYGGDVFPNLFTSAKGTIVTDSDGREYLDFTSGQMCATIGHNHPAIVEAVESRGQEGIPPVQRHDPRSRRRACAGPGARLAAGRSQATIFINTGSEATEVALRMAKMYTGGYEVLVLGGSWHGITGGASSVSMASDRKGYGVPAPGIFVIPEPNAYRPYIDRANARRQAALANLDLALKMFDMQSSGPRCRDHRRADHQRRRRAGAAQIVHAGAAQGG